MTVTTTTATTGTPAAGTQRSTPTNPNATLGKDDFLKLFVAQMQHQDPMSPHGHQRVDAADGAVLTLEQITNMASTNTQIASTLNTSSAVGLIGQHGHLHRRRRRRPDRQGREGRDHQGRQPSLTVAGNAGIDPSSITAGRLPASATRTGATPS